MNTAMVLAAGRGERLKPLTNHYPKGLCKVAGQALIVHHVQKLAKSGFKRIIINHAWLGGQIRQTLGNGKQFGVEIRYSPEPPGGLETGGGIVQALPLIGSEPFACINADVFTHYNFTTLPQPTKPVHLVLVPNPAHNIEGDFGLVNGTVTHQQPKHTFSGIAIYNPSLFEGLSIGRFSLTPLLKELIGEKKISGERYTGPWVDIGNLARLAQANQQYD